MPRNKRISVVGVVSHIGLLSPARRGLIAEEEALINGLCERFDVALDEVTRAIEDAMDFGVVFKGKQDGQTVYIVIKQRLLHRK